MPKVLILRLSSLGDVVQALTACHAIRSQFPESTQLHFLTKPAFAPLVKNVQGLDKVITLPEKLGPLSLFKFFYKMLRSGEYTHVYDAHNNLRSQLLGLAMVATLLLPPRRWGQVRWARRPKHRLRRLLLFRLRLNFFPKPYLARQSYLRPLKKWDVRLDYLGPLPTETGETLLPKAYEFLRNERYVALAPSAAWPLKIWPATHFRDLIAKMPEQKFVILGGPQDEFCQQFQEDFPDQVINLAGKLKLRESLAVLEHAQALVSADTGLLHWADSLEVPTVALLGPTAFGRTWAPTTTILERALPCRPCTKDGRGRCTESVYKRCMVDIAPFEVKEGLEKILKEVRPEDH